MLEYYQQGDVLFLSTLELPESYERKSFLNGQQQVIVAGNNNHTLQGQGYVVQDAESQVRFLVIGQEGQIVHPEHKPITLPPGIYEIRIVREYDHFAEEAREVAD